MVAHLYTTHTGDTMTTISLTNAHGYFNATATNMDKWTIVLAAYSVEEITAMIDQCTGYDAGFYSDVTSKSEALVMWCDLNPEDDYSPGISGLIAQYSR
jgi:hypothetical protein